MKGEKTEIKQGRKEARETEGKKHSRERRAREIHKGRRKNIARNPQETTNVVSRQRKQRSGHGTFLNNPRSDNGAWGMYPEQCRIQGPRYTHTKFDREQRVQGVV